MMNMPRPASDNTFQVAFKIPDAWVKLADQVAAMHSHEGAPLTRTDALRMALLRGLRDLEKSGPKTKK